MGLRRAVVSLLALALAGCASLPRAPAPISAAAAAPEGFDQVRIDASDPRLIGILQRNLADTRGVTGKPMTMLALSGGGAEGAFGAGVLAGWTKAGSRPEFRLVTGVSAGALIAPFAFLGPAWDAKMRRAFAGKDADGLLAPRGLGVLFGPSIYRGQPLEKLVDRYVDDDLLKAIARENAKGRKLLVATTDLDRQETVIWNLGAIAARGGPDARQLFRDVLVASASIPGVFPPKLISVKEDGGLYQEMHVDGGVSTPFFFVPPAALFWNDPTGLFDKARLYVIVNGQIERAPRTTSVNIVAVLGRSFDTVELSAMRGTLGETRAFCERNGIAFQAASLPATAPTAGPFDFSRKNRRRLFAYGERLGVSGEAWRSPAAPAS